MNEPLAAFEKAARHLWNAYLESGPGELDVVYWNELKARHANLLSPIPSSHAIAVQHIMDLAERCAERPEGLCFVTGEAGLLPRQADHQRFEDALAQLAQAVDDSLA